MKFVLKVLVLVGLIVIGKWEKENTLNASKKPGNVSYPVYSQNTDISVMPKQQQERGFERISVEYKY